MNRCQVNKKGTDRKQIQGKLVDYYDVDVWAWFGCSLSTPTTR